MNEAVDNLHAIEQLLALANAAPGADTDALQKVYAVLARLGLGSSASGYKAEKLKAVSDRFDAWLGSPQTNGRAAADISTGVARTRLVREIDVLRKALARGAEGQD